MCQDMPICTVGWTQAETKSYLNAIIWINEFEFKKRKTEKKHDTPHLTMPSIKIVVVIKWNLLFKHIYYIFHPQNNTDKFGGVLK